MKEMLKKKNIEFVDEVEGWIDAIQVAVQPLVNQGYCEQRYINGIIENTNKFGPYYVLCENLALLHASSEQGVIKKQMAITVLKKPIKFKVDGYDVRILITLCAEDPESHMEAMRAVSNIFLVEESISKILSSTTADEIYDLFISASKS